MELLSLFRNNIEESEREGLRRSLLQNNIRMGRMLAWVVLAFEACFAAMDASAAALHADNRFHYELYLAMYLAMILLNIAYLLLTRKPVDFAQAAAARVSRARALLTAYITVTMCWGAAVSLMDQKLYGQIIVFMVNMMLCSVVFSLDNRQLLIPYGASTALLAAGLPFFQSSSDVLVGHYVNLAFFLFISWAASRVVYVRHCNDTHSRKLLEEANASLERETERNRAAALLLADANRQLRKLSLVDELTGIANRRSFRNYIDTMFTGPVRENMTFSVVMMDLDYFKEYNDHYGHVEADRALAAVAGRIQAFVRHEMDLAARWGGEEFVYAAFGLTPRQAAEVAERMRRDVLALGIPHQYSAAQKFVSISAGYCTMEIEGKSDVSHCIERADRALYLAKACGRNRVEEYRETNMQE